MSLFWSQWAEAFYNPDLVKWLAQDWRIDIIRVPLGVEPDGYLSNPGRETDKVRRVIDAAIDAGIYVLLDWHTHRPHTSSAEDLFNKISHEFTGVSNLLYETWNEPGPQYGWTAHIKPHHERVIGVIRRNDPNALVIAGTEYYCQHLAKVSSDPLQKPNIMYSFHFYAATHKAALRRRAERAIRSGLPLFVSECGLSEACGGGAVDPAEFRRWATLLEREKVSYILWSIFDKAESSASLVSGASPKGGWTPEMLSETGRTVRTYLRRPVLSPKATRLKSFASVCRQYIGGARKPSGVRHNREVGPPTS